MRRDQYYFWGAHGLLAATLLFSWFIINDKFGFVLTAIIAAVAIFHNNKINRRRATVDLILKMLTDKELESAFDAISSATSDNLSELAKKAAGPTRDGVNDPDDNERVLLNHTLKVLNQYEFIAAGIREGAFDYKIFHRLKSHTTQRDWLLLHNFVVNLRGKTGKKTLFQEYEWLATEFKNHPLKTNFRNQ